MVTLVKFSIRCTQLSIQEIVARWYSIYLAFTSTNVQTLMQLSIQEIVMRWSVLLRQYLYFLC